MFSNSFDLSNIQAQVSSLCESASAYAESGFEALQKALPSLTKADAKTMVFGAALFASVHQNWKLTGVFTAIGAFWGETICDLASKRIELFNDLPSQAQYAIAAIAASALAVLAILKYTGHISNEMIKSAAAAAVGFYAGLVLSKTSE